MTLPTWLAEVTGDVVFATVSGAHLYGFPSADSDVDFEAKRAAEHGALPPDAPDLERLAADVARLTARLEETRDESSLPVRPSAESGLHDLVVRARLSAWLPGQG
jgi:hypothetical protein